MRSENTALDQIPRSFIETARRAQIVQCAVDAIAELGFAKASLAQIAKRASISTGVILYHFASKDELIRDVVAHVYAAGEAFVTPLVDRSSARQALRSFIEANLAFVTDRPNRTLATMNIARSGRSETGAPLFDPAVQQPRQAGLTSILQAGQANGEFRRFAVPVMVATIIEALDAMTPAMAADPSLDCRAYASELAELFDRATRNDREPVAP